MHEHFKAEGCQGHKMNISCCAYTSECV